MLTSTSPAVPQLKKAPNHHEADCDVGREASDAGRAERNGGKATRSQSGPQRERTKSNFGLSLSRHVSDGKVRVMGRRPSN